MCVHVKGVRCLRHGVKEVMWPWLLPHLSKPAAAALLTAVCCCCSLSAINTSKCRLVGSGSPSACCC